MAVILIGCNLFVPLFWAVGECLILPSRLGLLREEAGGNQWQSQLNDRERVNHVVPSVDRTANHLREWNARLHQWREQRERSQLRYERCLSLRALFVYGFFCAVGLAMVLLILYISPRTWGGRRSTDPLSALFTAKVSALPLSISDFLPVRASLD